jgi:hypothetical protein
MRRIQVAQAKGIEVEFSSSPDTARERRHETDPHHHRRLAEPTGKLLLSRWPVRESLQKYHR